MIFVGNIYSGLSSSGGGGGVMTLNNGLTLTGTNGELGGALVKNTNIDSGAFLFQLGDISGNTSLFALQGGGAPAASLSGSNASGYGGSVILRLSESQLFFNNVTGLTGFIINVSGLIVQDDILLTGLIGYADYSAAAKLNPLAYPQYAALSAWLTGTLSANATVDAN